jgi:hypothetical protein
MGEGDETVGFAAAVLRAEANDGRDFAAFSGKAEKDGFEQLFHAAGGIAPGEEGCGVEIVGGRGAVDDAGKIGHELVVADGSGQHVGTGTAGGEDGGETR